MYKLFWIVFWINIYKWHFFKFLFIERYGGIHIPVVVASKNACKGLVLFYLFKCIRCQPSSLKQKNLVIHETVKTGQQMLKSQRELKVQTRILYSTIFTFSVLSIKMTITIHNNNMTRALMYFNNFKVISTQFLKKIAKD